MKEFKYVVTDNEGIHARPAGELVKLVKGFESTISIEKEGKKVEIYTKANNENIILYIKDNGIGIKKGEITRVFEKGFTGENGRIINKKSTGIGLYLCKKLCNKLGLGIELNSEKNIGTEVKIIFPKSSYVELK